MFSVFFCLFLSLRPAISSPLLDLSDTYRLSMNHLVSMEMVKEVLANHFASESSYNAEYKANEGVSPGLASLVVKSYDAYNCSSEDPSGVQGVILSNYGCLDIKGLNVKIYSCSQEPSTVNLLFNLYADEDCASSSFVVSSSVSLGDTTCIPTISDNEDSTEIACIISDAPWSEVTNGLSVIGYECEHCEDSPNGPVEFYSINSSSWSCKRDINGLYYSSVCDGSSYTEYAYFDDACDILHHQKTTGLDCGTSFNDFVPDLTDDDEYGSLFLDPLSRVGYCSASNMPVFKKGYHDQCPLESDDDFCFHTNTVITYKGVEYSYEDLLSGKEVECSIPHTVVSRGVVIRTACNKTVRVTDTHLMATPRGYQAAFSLKAGDVLHGGWGGTDDDDSSECVVVSVEKEQSTQQYFGLNCAESVVLASGLRASTFGDFHALPSWYMKYVGNLQVVGMKGVVNMLGECMSGWYFSI